MLSLIKCGAGNLLHKASDLAMYAYACSKYTIKLHSRAVVLILCRVETNGKGARTFIPKKGASSDISRAVRIVGKFCR